MARLLRKHRNYFLNWFFDNSGILGINYSEMAGIFVEAIKELNQNNQELAKSLQAVEELNNQLLLEIQTMKKEIEKLSN